MDCHKFHKSAGLAAVARSLLATVFFLASILQGVTLCLCAPDPDECGEHCHDCGTVPEPQTTHIDHVCEHLVISVLSPAEKDTFVPVKVSGVSLQKFALYTDQMWSGVRLSVNQFMRPPGVLSPQLIFISCSTQLLC